jgi:hypothetical protein
MFYIAQVSLDQQPEIVRFAVNENQVPEMFGALFPD